MKPDAAASRKVVRPQLSMIIAAVFFWVCVPVNGVCKRLQFTIKLADVTIKRLTANSPSVARAFEAANQQEK